MMAICCYLCDSLEFLRYGYKEKIDLGGNSLVLSGARLVSQEFAHQDLVYTKHAYVIPQSIKLKFYLCSESAAPRM